MRINNIKYRKGYAALFLAAYIIFLGISIFHSHDLRYDTTAREGINEDADAVSLIDAFLNAEGLCLIHQFSSSISNYHAGISDLSHENSEKELILPDYTNPLFLSHKDNLYLRAPPKV